MKFTAVCMTTNLNDFNGPHQPTNLGVSGSNPFGRASLRDIPCESHGIHTATFAYPASSLRLCRIEFSVHARLHPRPRKSSVALGLGPGPGAGRGRAPRDPVEHCDHVLD